MVFVVWSGFEEWWKQKDALLECDLGFLNQLLLGLLEREDAGEPHSPAVANYEFSVLITSMK